MKLERSSQLEGTSLSSFRRERHTGQPAVFCYGLDPVSWALIGSAALGAGSTVYSAKKQKSAQNDAEDAADDLAKRSQLQASQAPIDTFKRKRKATQGFDAAATLVSGDGGGGLLGS